MRSMGKACFAGGVVVASLVATGALLRAAPSPWRYVVTSARVSDLGTLGGESVATDI